MSKIVDIKELKAKFTASELKKHASELFTRLESATKIIKEQEAKIQHLESMLLSVANKIELISPEQLTCEMEIKRLEETAKSRPLSLEEAKIFDIMNKNLLSIKKAKREDKPAVREVEGDVQDLLRIVSDETDK